MRPFPIPSQRMTDGVMHMICSTTGFPPLIYICGSIGQVLAVNADVMLMCV